jgi:TolA-binding protein
MSTLIRWSSVLFLVPVLAAVGCAPARSARPATATPVTKNRILEQQAGRKELEEARRMIEAGNYGSVLPRLLYLVGQYPNSKAAVDARYWLGVCYYRISSYRDAIDLFRDYLELAPDGEFAEASAKYEAQLLEEYEKKFWTDRKLHARITQLKDVLDANPEDRSAQWELADLLWKRGDYDEAGMMYATFVEKHPAYANDQTVRSRIEFLPSGEYIVLSPTEIQRRDIEKRPLVITNVSAWKGGMTQVASSSGFFGGIAFDRGAEYYVVTGQVTNRAESVLYGVQVYITLYGVGNVVFDARTVNFGRLNPGDTRAFSVRFHNFDDIHNISRYECTATFQR